MSSMRGFCTAKAVPLLKRQDAAGKMVVFGGFLLREILIIIKYIVLLSLRSQTPRAVWYNLKVCLSCFVC